jgi:hypothetical protein
MSAPPKPKPKVQALLAGFFGPKPQDPELKAVEEACAALNEDYKTGKVKPAQSAVLGKSADAIRSQRRREAAKAEKEAARLRSERRERAAKASEPAVAPAADANPPLLLTAAAAAAAPAAAPTAAADGDTCVDDQGRRRKRKQTQRMEGANGKQSKTGKESHRLWSAEERGMIVAAVQTWGMGACPGALGTKDKPSFAHAARKLAACPTTRHLFGVGSLKKPDGVCVCVCVCD